MIDQPTRERICELLADGKSLRAACRDVGVSESTVRLLEKNDAEFAAHSLRAREIGCHAMADECIDIADDGRNDTIETENGRAVNMEHIQRSRLRIDTRMRLLGKWLPKVYGEKVTNEVTGADGGPIVTRIELVPLDPK